jgi:hypothetical protein
MSVSIIDGRVELAELRRQRGKIHQYKTLRFALDGGGERTLKNPVVANELAGHLKSGTVGRFYLFNTMDVRGVYAYRDPAGSTVSAFPTNNEKLFLVLIVVNLLVITLFAMFGDGPPLLALIAFAIGLVGYVLTRRARSEAQRALAVDSREPSLARPAL